MSNSSFLALLIATLIPLVVLYFIYTRDLYQTGSFNFVLGSMVWGVMAFGLAYLINRYVIANGILERLFVVQFLAPFEEEIFKSLFLLYLVRRRRITYFVDAAIYGFAAGIGFAVIENFEYVLGAGEAAALSVAIGRVISTNLIHATGSAVIGIAYGLAHFSKGGQRLVQALTGLAMAILLHTGFNNLVTRVSSGLLLVYAAAAGIIGLGSIYLAIRRGLADEKAWIEEKLGMTDRVTANEAAFVHRIENMDDLLEPLSERFGEEKAKAIEKILLAQARIGILRKTLDKHQDERQIAETQREIAELRETIDEARRTVGSTTMLYLRSIFPADNSPVWGGLENLIAEHIASNPTPEGGGLWGKLESAAKPGTGRAEN